MTDPRWTGASTPYIESNQGDAWGKDAAAQGRKGTQRILSAGITPAPRDIAETFGLNPEDRVVERTRLILLDAQPVELAHSYWPTAVAGGTPLADVGKVRGGAVSLLADLGYHAGTVYEEVQTRPSTAEEVQLLRLPDHGEWVLTLTRTISTANGHPYEVSVMVSPGRIGRLHYSMKVD